MIERQAAEKPVEPAAQRWAWTREALSAPTPGAARQQVGAFARVMFRFLCAAALITCVEICRRNGARPWPPDRRTVGAALSFGAAGLLGLLLLWKSRSGAAREVLESAAMMGFWTGIFALLP
jgi:hypothetical protein